MHVSVTERALSSWRERTLRDRVDECCAGDVRRWGDKKAVWRWMWGGSLSHIISMHRHRHRDRDQNWKRTLPRRDTLPHLPTCALTRPHLLRRSTLAHMHKEGVGELTTPSPDKCNSMLFLCFLYEYFVWWANIRIKLCCCR